MFVAQSPIRSTCRQTEKKWSAASTRSRSRPHDLEQVVDNPPVVFIHLIIPPANLASRIDVLIDERIERFVHHVRRALEHPLELRRHLELADTR